MLSVEQRIQHSPTIQSLSNTNARISLEVISLTVAFGHTEAAARHHTHLTLEHLLYALAHDPDGERILAACGADLPQLRQADLIRKALDEHIGAVPARPAEGAHTRRWAFRVLQTAVPDVQSSGRWKSGRGDKVSGYLRQQSRSRRRRSCWPRRECRGSTSSSTSRRSRRVLSCRSASDRPDTAAPGDADAGIWRLRRFRFACDPRGAYAR